MQSHKLKVQTAILNFEPCTLQSQTFHRRHQFVGTWTLAKSNVGLGPRTRPYRTISWHLDNTGPTPFLQLQRTSYSLSSLRRLVCQVTVYRDIVQNSYFVRVYDAQSTFASKSWNGRLANLWKIPTWKPSRIVALANSRFFQQRFEAWWGKSNWIEKGFNLYDKIVLLGYNFNFHRWVGTTVYQLDINYLALRV